MTLQLKGGSMRGVLYKDQQVIQHKYKVLSHMRKNVVFSNEQA